MDYIYDVYIKIMIQGLYLCCLYYDYDSLLFE